MSVSVNYTSFTKTREGNETLPGSLRRPHARFLHCPRSAHVPGFLRGTRRGPGAGAVGGKRPRREETTRVGGRGGGVKGKELQAAGGCSGHTSGSPCGRTGFGGKAAAGPAL